MSAVRWKKNCERGGEREDENKKFKSGAARKVREERRLRMRMGEKKGDERMQRIQEQEEPKDSDEPPV